MKFSRIYEYFRWFLFYVTCLFILILAWPIFFLRNIFTIYKYKKFIFFTITAFFLDIITKIYFSYTMKLHESIKLIEGYFNFALVHNYGAAFGILQHYTKFILVVAFFSLFLLLYFSKHFLNNDNKLLQIASGLLFGGALGNIIDRFVNGYVVDFIQVGYKNHYWPVFNLADTFVNIGVFLFIYDLFLKNFFLIFLKYLNLFGKKKNIEN